MIVQDCAILIFLFLVVARMAQVVHTDYMNIILQKVVRAYKQIRGLFPSALPVGTAQFDAWVDDFRSTYRLATDDRDSVIFTLATMIMHFGPSVAYKSNFWFYKAFQAAAAKQIAGGTFYELKKAHQAKQAAEVTVSGQITPPVASNGPKQ